LDGQQPRQPSNRPHNHGGADHHHSGMAAANQSPYPWEPLWKGLGEHGLNEGFDYFNDAAEKKLICVLKQLNHYLGSGGNKKLSGGNKNSCSVGFLL
jgi:hypothetical protein